MFQNRNNDHGDGFSQALTMLHNTITHTTTDARDSVLKRLDSLEESGKEAQKATREAVTTELSRMRADLRDAKNQLAANRTDLGHEVHGLLNDLRGEIRELADALGNSRQQTVRAEPGTPADLDVAAVPSPRTEPSVVLAETGTGSLPMAVPGSGAAEERQDTPATGWSEDSDSHEPASPAEEVEKDTAKSSVSAGLLASPAGDAAEAVTSRLHQELQSLHAGIDALHSQGTALREELHTQVTAAREELTALASRLDSLSAQPAATDGEDQEGEPVPPEHSDLLKQAARISSVRLVCHRDTWEFVTGQAGRHPHFRMPPKITDHDEHRIAAALSGRSLIAVLITLFTTQRTAAEGDGDWEMATAVYGRIEEGLTVLASEGDPVTITLDDRSPTTNKEADNPDQTGPTPHTADEAADATEETTSDQGAPHEDDNGKQQ